MQHTYDIFYPRVFCYVLLYYVIDANVTGSLIYVHCDEQINLRACLHQMAKFVAGSSGGLVSANHQSIVLC